MKIDEAYKKSDENFLFVKLKREVELYKKQNPKCEVIDLGVGDVKLPPIKCVGRALKKAADIISDKKGFKGYPPAFGYDFLREKISADYAKKGACVLKDEIFITDGAKRAICDLVEIVRPEKALILSPTYPLYADVCKAKGVDFRLAGSCEQGEFFALPSEDFSPDVIFICSPNNPTGSVISDETLEKYVDYALEKSALIIFDGAYRSFLKGNFCVYKTDGAASSVAEVRSYSKSLSFTGVRCGYTVIKKENPLYPAYRRHALLHSNGVSFISQYGASAAYSKLGTKQLDARVEYYKKSAKILKEEISKTGAKLLGGENAPYLFLKTPCSGEQFSCGLLRACGVVVTPGEGFGAQNYVRISCFCNKKQALSAGKKIAEYLREVCLKD